MLPFRDLSKKLRREFVLAIEGEQVITSLDVGGWDISGITNSTNIFNDTNAVLTVYCDQAGSAGTGFFFGKMR